MTITFPTEKKVPHLVILSVKTTEEKKASKYISCLCRLEGGLFPLGRSVLFPGGKEFTVKSLTEQKEGIGCIEVKGVARAALKKGRIILPRRYGVRQGTRALAVVLAGSPPQGTLSLERTPLGKERGSNQVVVRSRRGWLDLRFTRETLLIPAGKYGYRDDKGRVGSFLILYPGQLTPLQEEACRVLLAREKGAAPRRTTIDAIMLTGDEVIFLPSEEEQRDRDAWPPHHRYGQWLVSERVHLLVQKALKREEGSASLAKIGNKCDWPASWLKEMARQWRRKPRDQEMPLSPSAAALLKKVKMMGKRGFDARALPGHGGEKITRELVEKGFLLKVGTGRFMDEHSYQELKRDIERGGGTLGMLRKDQGVSRSLLEELQRRIIKGKRER